MFCWLKVHQLTYILFLLTLVPGVSCLSRQPQSLDIGSGLRLMSVTCTSELTKVLCWFMGSCRSQAARVTAGCVYYTKPLYLHQATAYEAPFSIYIKLDSNYTSDQQLSKVKARLLIINIKAQNEDLHTKTLHHPQK